MLPDSPHLPPAGSRFVKDHPPYTPAHGEADAWLAVVFGVPLADRYTAAQVEAQADRLYPGGFAAIVAQAS